jgi:hypothetical protein
MKKIIFLILFLVFAMGVVATPQDCANRRGDVNDVIEQAASGSSQARAMASSILKYTTMCCGKELSSAEQDACGTLFDNEIGMGFLSSILGQNAQDVVDGYALRYCYGYTWDPEEPDIAGCGCDEDCDELKAKSEAISEFMVGSDVPQLTALGLDLAQYFRDCCEEDGTCLSCSDQKRTKAANAVIEMLGKTEAGGAYIAGEYMTPVDAAKILMEYMQCCCECKKVTSVTAGGDDADADEAVNCDVLHQRAEGCALDLRSEYGMPTFNWLRSSILKCKQGQVLGSHERSGLHQFAYDLSADGDSSTEIYCGFQLMHYIEQCCPTEQPSDLTGPSDDDEDEVMPPTCGADGTAIGADSDLSGLAPHQRAAQVCADMMARLNAINAGTTGHDSAMVQSLMDCIQRCCDQYADSIEGAYGPGDSVVPFGEDVGVSGDLQPYYPDSTPVDVAYPGVAVPPIYDDSILWDPGETDLQALAPQDVMTLRTDVSVGQAFGLGETSTVSNIVWVGLAIIAIIILLLIFKGKKK